MSGCSARAPVKSASPAAHIRRIAIQNVEGAGAAAVTQALIKAVSGSGLVVADRRLGVDAVLAGSVIEYKSGRKQIVILGNTNAVLPGGQTVVISNPVISLAGPQVTLQNAGMGLKSPQIVVENAAVGVSLRLEEVPGGQVLWADRYTYESLDVQLALQTVVGTLVQSLRQAAPRLQHKPAPLKKG